MKTTEKNPKKRRVKSQASGNSTAHGQNKTRMAWIAGCILTPILLSTLLLVIFNISRGTATPELPKNVQRWRDSGFTFQFGNTTVFYQDIFSLKPHKKEPVLLILHGFPTSSYDWKKVIFHLLSPFGRIVAPDMIGFGFSDKGHNRSYSIFEQATMHEELLQHLNITKVHLLAHDIGDTVGQEMIARYEERRKRNDTKLELLSICVSNGGLVLEEYRPRLIQRLLLVKYVGDMISSFLTFTIFDKGFSEVFGDNSKPSTADLEDFWSIISWNNGHLIGARLIRYIPEFYANRDRWMGALQNTSVPVHLIHGMADPVNTENAVNAFQKLVPQSSVYVLNEIGHYPQWESPAEFLRGYFKFTHRLGLGR